MSNLNQVLAFIKNADKSELSQIQNAYAIRKSEINYDVKSSFKIGDIVGINHRKMDPSKSFRITKINSKNIKVVSSDDMFTQYTVSPSLLVKK
jgi:PIN domain nuclease of toxin-antitoxin system